MRYFVMILGVITLGGCTSPISELILTSPNTFTYWQYARGKDDRVLGIGVNVNKNSSEAEATRLAGINSKVTTGGICPNGYKITNRTEMKDPSALFGLINDDGRYKIYYNGECLPPPPPAKGADKGKVAEAGE